MADIARCRAGLAANLRQIEDLQVSEYVLSNPTYPTAVIFLGRTEYDKAFSRGLDSLIFRIRVVVAAVTDIGAETNLDEYLDTSGPRSIKQAVEAERTLGGACDDLRVTETEGEQVFTFESQPQALGAEWLVEVQATG